MTLWPSLGMFNPAGRNLSLLKEIGNDSGAGARLMKCSSVPGGGKGNLARLGEDCRGNAIVELALTMPLLAIILLGIFKLCVGVNNYLILESAVSQGVYVVANNASDTTLTTDPCYLAYTTVANVVASQFDPEQLVFSLKLNNNPTAFSGTGHSFSCPESPTGTFKSVIPNDPVILSVSYPVDLNILGYVGQNLSDVNIMPSNLMTVTAQQNVQVVTQ